jgi:hypothetical protein
MKASLKLTIYRLICDLIQGDDKYQLRALPLSEYIS